MGPAHRGLEAAGSTAARKSLLSPSPGGPGPLVAPPTSVNVANALACRIKPTQSSLVSPTLCSIDHRWDCRGWGNNGEPGTDSLGQIQPQLQDPAPMHGWATHARGRAKSGIAPSSPSRRDELCPPPRGQPCPGGWRQGVSLSLPAPGRCSTRGHRCPAPGSRPGRLRARGCAGERSPGWDGGDRAAPGIRCGPAGRNRAGPATPALHPLRSAAPLALPLSSLPISTHHPFSIFSR